MATPPARPAKEYGSDFLNSVCRKRPRPGRRAGGFLLIRFRDEPSATPPKADQVQVVMLPRTGHPSILCSLARPVLGRADALGEGICRFGEEILGRRKRPGVLGMMLLLLVFAPFSPVYGQDTDLQTLLENGRRAGVQMERMQEVVESAAKAGRPSVDVAKLLGPALSLAEQKYPSTPLLRTVLEGLSKNVPTARLRAVLEAEQVRVGTSGQLVSRLLQEQKRADVSRQSRFQLIESVAQARRRGLPYEGIGRLWTALHESQRPSFSLLASAIEMAPKLPGGVSSPGSARTLLVTAVENGYDESQLRELASSLNNRGHRRRPPSALAASAARAIARGAPTMEPRAPAFSFGGPEGMPGQAAFPGVPPGLDVPAQGPDRRRPEPPSPR